MDTIAESDLGKLRREFGCCYDIFRAGQVICAYRDGREGPPLRAMTEDELAAKLRGDHDPGRPGALVPHARPAS